MARINFDDDVDSNPAYWPLLQQCRGNRLTALGALVILFRLAQNRFVQDIPITKSDLEIQGIECVINTGWLIDIDGGYQVKNPEKHFGWYRSRVENSRKGGQKNGAKHKDNKINKNVEPRDSREILPDSPLSLSLSLSPSFLKERSKEHVTFDASVLGRLWNEYCGVLTKLRDPSNLSEKRKKDSKKILQRFRNPETLIEAIQKMANSKFCRGEKNSKEHPNWKADFDFFTRDGVIDRILEGRYDDQGKKPGEKTLADFHRENNGKLQRNLGRGSEDN